MAMVPTGTFKYSISTNILRFKIVVLVLQFIRFMGKYLEALKMPGSIVY